MKTVGCFYSAPVYSVYFLWQLLKSYTNTVTIYFTYGSLVSTASNCVLCGSFWSPSVHLSKGVGSIYEVGHPQDGFFYFQ